MYFTCLVFYSPHNSLVNFVQSVLHDLGSRVMFHVIHTLGIILFDVMQCI